jgi:hypothetical protein
VAEASPPSIIGRLVDTEKCRVGDGVGFLKESLHRAVSGRHFFFSRRRRVGVQSSKKGEKNF